MKVFVTGASGFIGGHLVRHLLQAGHEVLALVRPRTACTLPPAVQRIDGDLAGISAWQHHLQQVDALAHVAARYRIGVVGPRQRQDMAASNITGTQAVLAAGLRAGVARMLYVSSTAALGETHGQLRDESWRHNGRFRSFYEQTKHVAHGLALDLQRQGAPLNIAIPGGVFGPGDRSDLAQVLRQFLDGKLPAQVDSTSRFQLCHVDGLCDGLLRLLTQGGAGRNYLFTGESVSMAELLARVAARHGLPEPRKVPRHKLLGLARLSDALRPLGLRLALNGEALSVMDGSSYLYASTRAEDELGWPGQQLRAQFWDQFDHYIAGLRQPQPLTEPVPC